MLYMLVMCAGQFCMPIDAVGDYTFTLDECENRVAELERTSRIHARCYSSEDMHLSGDWMVVQKYDWGVRPIAH